MKNNLEQQPLSFDLHKSLDIIRQVTDAINQNEQPEQVLDHILQTCIEITNSDSGSIMLIDPAQKHLQMRVRRGLTPANQSLRLKIGEGITGWVAQHGKARIIHDAREAADYIKVKPGLLSELAVPMIIQDQVIGVLSVDSTRTNAFVDEQKEFLSIMANLAARIFINLKDNQSLKIRDRFHRVMIEISRLTSRSLHLKDIFREMMQITERAFRLHRSTLLLYDQDEDSLRIAAASELLAEEIAQIRYAPGEGISGQVFLSKKAVFIPNVKDTKDFLNRMKMHIDDEDLSFFCAPVFSESEVVGVFSTFMRPQEEVDPQFVLEFLQILGSYLSQAITIQKLVQDEAKVVRFENIQLKQELYSRYQFGSLIGRSELIRNLFEKARIVADSRASVLIAGESGTGKELIASALHYNSPRRDGPFIKLNCAAIPEQLLESELFGHRKGAFTGAISDRKGKFEAAHGGTIFLDEISELHLNLQSKLLRVLQEREVEPIGGKLRSVDIRIIAATNIDLEEAVKERSFRADLFYRLNVIYLEIPPLRQRIEDIVPLAYHFIKKYSKENKKNIDGISHRAIEILEAYHWPGNVRQLENNVERAVVLGQKNILDENDFADLRSFYEKNKKQAFEQSQPQQNKLNKEKVLPNAAPLPHKQQVSTIENKQPFLSDLEEALKLQGNEGHAYDQAVQSLERELIMRALRKFRYTKSQTARHLGINRNTLDKKIRQLNIDY